MQVRKQSFLSNLLTALSAYLGVVLVAVALARFWHFEVIGSHRTDDETSGLILAVGIVLLAVRLVYWLRVWWTPFRRGESLDELRDGLIHPVPPPSGVDVVSTVLLVLDTARYLPRVVEEIQVGDGYYVHNLSSQFHLPRDRDDGIQDKDGLFLVPRIRIGRGAVYDNFIARDASGSKLNTLNTDEVAGLNEHIIKTLVRGLVATDSLDAITTSIVDSILEHIRRDGPLEGTAEALEATPPSTFDPIDRLVGLARPDMYAMQAAEWETARLRLSQYCKAIARDHIVFAAVEGRPDSRLTVEYTYTRRHAPENPARREKVRYWFGLRPHKHDIPVLDHIVARSYHLEFRAPMDQYVYECSAQAIGSRGRGSSALDFGGDSA